MRKLDQLNSNVTGKCGIYTLANDTVYNQLVALLNSIEVNDDLDLPVCVIPYDNNITRIRDELGNRKGVSLFEDEPALETWRQFSRRAWSAHPTALGEWERKHGIRDVHRIQCNHRYVVFDPRAPFEKFIYMDADTLLLDSPRRFFDGLSRNQFVAYDFQFKHPQHVFHTTPEIAGQVFERDAVFNGIFCSGCFASQRGLFGPATLSKLLRQLHNGDADLLYLNAPNQSLLNYMVMKSNIAYENLAHTLPRDMVTGNAVTSAHFISSDGKLYDRGKPLTYLHYIGVPTRLFDSLSEGSSVDVRYGEIFLHYRWMTRRTDQ